MIWDTYSSIRCSEPYPGWPFVSPKDGASTTSQSTLSQCLTTLTVKYFLLISSLNLLFISLKPLPLVLSKQTQLKSLSLSFLQLHFRYWKVSPEPSLLQTEQPQLSQPVLIGDMFDPLEHFCGPPLDALQQLHVSAVLRTPLWTQYSRWGLTSTEQRGRITSLALLATLLLMQPQGFPSLLQIIHAPRNSLNTQWRVLKAHVAGRAVGYIQLSLRCCTNSNYCWTAVGVTSHFQKYGFSAWCLSEFSRKIFSGWQNISKQKQIKMMLL